MMKNHLLLLIALFAALTGYGKKTSTGDPLTATDSIEHENLTGTWRLDSVKIKQITPDGDTISLPYSKEAYMNSLDCIFPVLKIEAEQCVIGTENDLKYTLKYTFNNNTFTLWFSSLTVFKSVISGNTLSISRQYNKHDSDDKTILVLVNLIYTKDKNK
jgi:hypothetical protein